MKTFYATITALVLLAFAFTPQASGQEGMRASDAAGAPTVFCKVVKEPDPALLGGWSGVHNRWISKFSRYEADPVGFWLKKYGDKYALYFYRSKAAGGDRVLKGWRPWTINGKEITSSTGVRLYTENGEVFFSWERAMKEKPTRLTPIGGN
jgi:hypothetical protein